MRSLGVGPHAVEPVSAYEEEQWVHAHRTENVRTEQTANCRRGGGLGMNPADTLRSMSLDVTRCHSMSGLPL